MLMIKHFYSSDFVAFHDIKLDGAYLHFPSTFDIKACIADFENDNNE